MGTVRKTNNSIFIFFIFLVSCSLLEKGYTNQYGQYVPKSPRYRLKGRQGTFPDGLDTVNVYKLVYFSTDGHTQRELNYDAYLVFFPKGRVGKIVVPAGDSLNVFHLNPNNRRFEKCYWRSPDGKTVQIESFVIADGFGMYIILDYNLVDLGSTLTIRDRTYIEVFRKKLVPNGWRKRYPVDW